MKILSVLLLVLLPLKVFALEAVVTVLETPLLKHKDINAPVVQYLRKGDVIKLHPSLKSKTSLKNVPPSMEWKDDLFLTGDVLEARDSDSLIPTWDRQGHIVYVIRDHLYIYYEDERELSQIPLKKDPTDYRLGEPLTKNYPLATPTGYRGQFILGLTSPYYESYPYVAGAKTKGYISPLDMNVSYMRKAKGDEQDRFFIGGNFNLRYFSNSYILTNGRSSDETGLKLGVGPMASYDVYKGEENRISLYGVISVNLFNQIKITQRSATSEDSRNYRTISLAPRLGVQYHRKSIMEDIDFVLGTSIEVEAPARFRARESASQPSWWNKDSDDTFKTRTAIGLAGYIGVQTAY